MLCHWTYELGIEKAFHRGQNRHSREEDTGNTVLLHIHKYYFAYNSNSSWIQICKFWARANSLFQVCKCEWSKWTTPKSLESRSCGFDLVLASKLPTVSSGIRSGLSRTQKMCNQKDSLDIYQVSDYLSYNTYAQALTHALIAIWGKLEQAPHWLWKFHVHMYICM